MVLLLALAGPMAGCLGPPDPRVSFQVVGIEQSSSPGGSHSQPQVIYNVSVDVTNVGKVRYKVSGSDWSFETDTGLGAFVGAWRWPDDAGADVDTLEPHEELSFTLVAYQIGHMHGNITGARFRDDPVQPV